MRQSEEIKYRTEIAQLKATLHQLRFALPLKKAAEELIEACNAYPQECSASMWLALSNLREAIENKKRYEAVRE